jgi:hypothetical protein
MSDAGPRGGEPLANSEDYATIIGGGLLRVFDEAGANKVGTLIGLATCIFISGLMVHPVPLLLPS